ncbi:MAG: tRNA threonylcarbamoyladenosine biosynthesis protein TsaE [Alteromonas naphthalenivorans]|jgi:tRNA threonylcarbamoyladenosine biosynthesis protein TsaE
MQIKQNDIPEIAQELLEKKAKIYTFEGSLGAGKTTLVQAMLRSLGVQEAIQSPTYMYVCIYMAADGRKIYHFDLYRLNTLDQFIQAGFEEYLNDDNVICFIEWPEIIKPLLDQNVCQVILEYNNDQSREITIK